MLSQKTQPDSLDSKAALLCYYSCCSRYSSSSRSSQALCLSFIVPFVKQNIVDQNLLPTYIVLVLRHTIFIWAHEVGFLVKNITYVHSFSFLHLMKHFLEGIAPFRHYHVNPNLSPPSMKYSLKTNLLTSKPLLS